jgi:hypothetical protein
VANVPTFAGAEQGRYLPAHPSPGPADAPPGAGQALPGGPDARYEHLRHAALHARAEAFPLGLAVLTRRGLTAWTRALAELTPTPTAPARRPADPPTPSCAALTRELVNILAALTLAST